MLVNSLCWSHAEMVVPMTLNRNQEQREIHELACDIAYIVIHPICCMAVPCAD